VEGVSGDDSATLIGTSGVFFAGHAQRRRLIIAISHSKRRYNEGNLLIVELGIQNQLILTDLVFRVISFIPQTGVFG